ncbi:FCD domain-containing protein [Orrella sp. JC864]|uniref:FadR/GntR family transcriptional regulator n=1 Tax=Orrella sp. JC864 TaxID=3120298 RepID=UPI0012BBB9BC
MDKAAAMREAILENLRSGRWPAGHRLPTERTLGEQFGISRSTVRRALAQLKSRGLIVQTVGSGTYVNDPAAAHPAAAPAHAAAPASPAELMAARLALEPAIAAMVAQHATQADFDRMEHCCEQAENAGSFEAFEHWDTQLHETIAQATHNTFVAQVFALMSAARASASWGALKRKSLTPARRQAYQREHRELVEALKDRDAARAAHAARRHLAHVRESVLGD